MAQVCQPALSRLLKNREHRPSEQRGEHTPVDLHGSGGNISAESGCQILQPTYLLAMGSTPIVILEDNEDDARLLLKALQKNGINDPTIVLPDGVEGAAYLSGQGKYADRRLYPLPRVLIVDMKMPRMNGLEFLQWLKSHPGFRVIPTLVLSSSQLESDVKQAYGFGINSYMVKPTNFDDLQSLVKVISDYWQRCVVPRFPDLK
jgi:CheY-like chemotaxis protein